jgi:amino acid transporter
MILTALFCMGDLASAAESALHYPFVQILYISTQSTVGTTVMVTVVIALSYAATFGQFAGASRQLWAFARDRGPPMSDWLVRVSPPSIKLFGQQVPVANVWV